MQEVELRAPGRTPATHLQAGCPAEARAENCSKPKSRINLGKRPCRMLLKLAAPAQNQCGAGWRRWRRGPPVALPEA